MTIAAKTSHEDIVTALVKGDLLGTKSPPERIETHCSLIYLTPERAFKLKKPVTFSYLDYGSLDARERFIKAELELNRRTAPELYLARHKIIRDDGGKLALVPPEDSRPALDWLLEMNRFPDQALLSDLAARNALSAKLIRDLADAVHEFHQTAEQRPAHGGATETDYVLQDCIDNLRRHAPPLDRRMVERLAIGLKAAFDRQRHLIEQRRRAGRVRQCHGDLHLGNICLLDDRPVLFDCIEFSDRLSCIDVAYDLAFLLMDLCHRGRANAVIRGFANLLLNRWIDRSGDTEALALMPFYQSLRAAIRAHVLATAHRDDDAVAYLESALLHLESSRPRQIAIGGLSGSGKSTLAFALAPDFRPLPGARIIRSDSLRKRLAGVAPETRLSPDSYTRDMSELVYQTMMSEARLALVAGYTVIVDAAFLRARERVAVATIARDLSLPFDGIWLDVPADILRSRLAQRRDDASDADVAVLESQLAVDLGRIDWRRLIPGKDMAGDVAALRRALSMV